jgi:hypothetical protein
MAMTNGSGLDADLAARWLRSVVPSWIYRYLMPALWVAAIAASMASDDQPCSAADPTVCGPDATFSVAMVVCFGSLVLWWWLPRLAALSGVLFALLDLRYDDVAGARFAWAGYATVCLVVLAALTVSRRRQRALTAGLRRIPVIVRAATPSTFTLPLGVAGVLVIVGVAALGVMRWQEQREDVHLGRAVLQSAVVEAVDDQGDLKLRLSDGSRRTVSPLDQYAVGTEIQVLVDAADPHWVRLPAELADYTPWYTVAGGAWVLALLLAAREIRHRRALPPRSWTAPGLPVRIAPDVSSAFAILPADGSERVVGFLMVDLDDEEADGRLLAAFDALGEEAEEVPRPARKEWEKVLRRYEGEALLVGELVEGEWPTVVLGDTVMRPSGPFRAPRQKPWAIFGRGGSEERDGLPVGATADDRAEDDEPVVEAARDIPTLPWRLPLEHVPWWSRVLLVGPFVVVPVLIWWLWSEPLDWWGASTATLIGFSVLRFTAARVFYRVEVSTDDVRVRTGAFEESISWQQVNAVDLGEDSVVLGTGEDWLEIGGIAEGRAAEVAAVLEALRLRARHGLPASPSRRRVGPSISILAAYLVVCGALLVTLRGGV